MRVLLIDVDKICNKNLDIPNQALIQASGYHLSQGDTTVLFKEGVPSGINFDRVGKVYISCIFEKHAHISHEIGRMFVEKNVPVRIGGTGLNIAHDWLPEEMQKARPDYNLYPSVYSQGYTTRGCIRDCGFCVVPAKEGRIHTWQHPSEFHDDRFDTCMVLANNLFGAQQAWQDSVFEWFIENKIKMLSPQGWDARLLNNYRADLLKDVKHVDGQIHFAWDQMKDEKAVIRAIGILKDHGFNLRRNITFYVLCGCTIPGYQTTFEQDLYRCNKLRELGVRAYAMRYRQTPELNALARWTQPRLFWKVSFDDYTRQRGLYR